MAGTVTNSEFLRSLTDALLALTGSALLLFIFFLVYFAATSPEGAGNTYRKVIAGEQFEARMGTTQLDGNLLKVTALQNFNNNGNALVTTNTSFRADNYPLLAYQFTNQQPGLRINFIWRTATNPRQLYTTPLHWNVDKHSTFNLAAHDNWQGTITEVGIHLVGGLRGQAVGIDQLVFAPPGWRGMVAAIWSEWTAFRGWTGTSINYLTGTPALPGEATLPPTPVVAAWSGLALTLLYIFGVIRQKQTLVGLGATLLIPWMALDLLWQSELTAQLAETKYLFSGKSAHEKHLADRDQRIYSYTKRLKEEVLPSSPARIFILHDSEGHNYDRLKAQYYLLPHNIYNYGRIPPAKAIGAGDFILVLGEVPGMSYQQETSLLTWGKGKSLSVKPLDSEPPGQLFQVGLATAQGTAQGETTL